MSPRCIKPKCLKRVPIYIPVHRPCLDSLHIPNSRPCILPYFNVQSSCMQQNHPVCHCRDQSCSVKICNPNNWALSHPHFYKIGESNEAINGENSEINREESDQCKILDGGNLDGELVEGVAQTNSKDKYLEDKNENINEVEKSQLHFSTTNNQTSNTQTEEDFAKRQPLLKMPLNRDQRKSKTSDTIIRNSLDDSRSNVRHVGSTIVPETSCKGIQVSLLGPFSKNQLNRTQNVSRNKFTSEHANGRELYNDVTYDNRRESLIERDNFNQLNVNREGCYNNRNALNPCCQSKYIQATQRDFVDLFNNELQTSSDNINREYSIEDNEKRLIRPLQDTNGSGTSRPLANFPREHLVSTNRNPTEYTSHSMKKNNTKEITSNISPVQSQTGFNPVQNHNGYTLNDKINSHGRNNYRNWNDLQPPKGSREMALLKDIDEDNIPILQNQRQNLFQQKPCCKESAEQNKPVTFPMNSGTQKQILQSKDGLFLESLSSGSKEKACCNHGISELVNKRGNKEPDMALEHQLGKLTKKLDCACNDKGAGRDLKSTKKTCDRQIDTISRASVGCTASQGTKCHCCYPPSFKQFTCAGNINGSCSCDD